MPRCISTPSWRLYSKTAAHLPNRGQIYSKVLHIWPSQLSRTPVLFRYILYTGAVDLMMEPRPRKLLDPLLAYGFDSYGVQRVIYYLHGVYKLVVQLLYGSELRLSEGLQLRVKDWSKTRLRSSLLTSSDLNREQSCPSQRQCVKEPAAPDIGQRERIQPQHLYPVVS